MTKSNLVILSLLINLSISLAQEPCYSCNQKALFNSFLEYKFGISSRTDSFTIDSVARTDEQWLGTYSYIIHRENKKSIIDDVWGFSDGTRCFVKYDDDFYPIQEQNGYLVFLGLSKVNEVDPVGVVAAGVVGGAVGATVYTAIANGKSKFPSIKIYIDTLNGWFYAHDLFLRSNYIYEPVKLAFYREKKNEVDATYSIIVDDTNRFEMVPNSYFELEYPITYKPIKIQYGADTLHTTFSVIQPQENKFFKCSFTDNGNYIIAVAESTGEFESYYPRKKQAKRTK